MDLIFAPQSILVVESGVKSSMHQKLSSPNNAIYGFQWEKQFESINVNDMVHLFNRTVKNMPHNFILHEIITFE